MKKLSDVLFYLGFFILYSGAGVILTQLISQPKAVSITSFLFWGIFSGLSFVGSVVGHYTGH